MKSSFILLFFFYISPLKASNNVLVYINDTISNDSIWKNVELGNVVVEGSNVIHKLGKDIWTFTEEMRKNTYDTNDILAKIPGFYLERITRSLSYMGDSNILLLIDGREKGNSFIGDLANMRFQKVEVEQNPTGRYHGYAAVLNLITKEDWIGFDFKGSIDTQMTPSNKYGETVSKVKPEVNYTHTNPVIDYSFSSSYEHSNEGQKEYWEQTEGSVMRDHSIDNDHTTSWKYNNHYSIWGDIDYRISKDHILSAKYQVLSYNNNLHSSYLIERKYLDKDIVTQMLRNTRNDENITNHIWTLYYRGKLGKWNLYADTSFDWQRNHREHGNMENNYVVATDSREYRTLWKQNIDVSHNYGQGNINFGYQGYIRKYSIKVVGLTDKNKQRESRNRFYASFNQKLSSHFSTNASAAVIVNHNKNMLGESETRWAWDANIRLRYRLNKSFYSNLTYNYSVKYPLLVNMSTIRYQLDSLLYQSGNPSITPEHQHEFKWMTGYKRFQFFVQYVLCNDRISTVYRKDGDQTWITYDNTRHSYWYIYGYYNNNLEMGKNGISYEAMLYYTNYKRDYQDLRQRNDSWGFNANLFYNHHKYGMIGIMYDTNAPIYNTLQGENRYCGYDAWRLYYSREFAKKKLSLRLTYTLPIKWGLTVISYSMTQTPFYSQYSSYNNFNINRNKILLSVTYRFAKGRQVRKQRNTQTIESETFRDNP